MFCDCTICQIIADIHPEPRTKQQHQERDTRLCWDCTVDMDMTITSLDDKVGDKILHMSALLLTNCIFLEENKAANMWGK